MIHWLSRTAKETRQAAGRKAHHIAYQIDVNPGTIYRFENGLQPQKIDEIIEAYAAECGTTARRIWAEALQLWLAEEPPTPQEDFEELLARLLATAQPSQRPRRKASDARG